MSPYYFSSIADEVRAKHLPQPDESTCATEIEAPVEYPAGEWLLWLAVAALSVLACHLSPVWITP